MTKQYLIACGILVILGVGCSEPAATVESSSDVAPATDGQISPDNTSISFLGTKPDGTKQPGGFAKFEGSFKMDGDSLASLQVEIDIESLWTDEDRLTNRLTGHLKSVDFFDAKEFPLASFLSTAISPSTGTGEYDVTGDLTMHGTTAEITFSVTVDDSAETILRGEFTIDRTAFGMNFRVEEIHKEVIVTIGPPSAASPVATDPET